VTSDRATPEIDAYCNERATNALELLRELVEIESPSGDAASMARLAQRVAECLERSGAAVELLDSRRGPNLLARFGTGERPILLLGHLDTVWTKGTLETIPWRVEDGFAYGPGVFDMKAGVVIAIETLSLLAHLGSHVPITVLLTCAEEIGSGTSRALLEREARASRAVLVLEPPLPGGGAKTSRSGVAGYSLKVTGRAAHAGLDPEKGISAIGVLAEIVTQLHALTDIPNGLTVNVGTISGGTRSNVIAAEATAEVDVRFRTAAQAKLVDDAVRNLRPSVDDAVVDVRGGINRPPFERSAATMDLFAVAFEAARVSGFELRNGHVGGASDGNYTAAIGAATLDGLGADGAGAHATHEHVVVADLPRRIAMLARLLTALDAREIV